MTREEAIVGLTSDVPAERLASARFLQFWAVASDILDLRSALHAETVGWVRRALDAALRRLGDSEAKVVDLDHLVEDEEQSSATVKSVARATVARTLVHEVEPILGAIDYYAMTEWSEYSTSKTKQNVERLGQLLRAIETVSKVNNAPSYQQVDIVRLLAKIVDVQQLAFGFTIRMDGPDSLTLETDASLIDLIITNGLKNACEALGEMAGGQTAVYIIYGASDRDVWISIVDTGEGLPLAGVDRLFDMGTTTKVDHLGMGLTIASEAAAALGAELRLTSDHASTRFELTIPERGGVQ